MNSWNCFERDIQTEIFDDKARCVQRRSIFEAIGSEEAFEAQPCFRIISVCAMQNHLGSEMHGHCGCNALCNACVCGGTI